MLRRAILFVLVVLSLDSFTLKAADQKAKPSALTTCQAEVDRLKAENAELQKKLNDILTQQLDAMKKKQAESTEAETTALAAIRAVASVMDTASYGEFKKYLLDAKVKVDGLPSGAAKEAMAPLVASFLDIEFAWQARIRNSNMTAERCRVMEKDFPGVSAAITSFYNQYTREHVESCSPEQALPYMIPVIMKKVETFSLTSRPLSGPG